MRLLKYIFIALCLSFISYESHAQLVSIRIGRPSPPPPPRAAYRPSCPGPDYIWHDGRWAWDDYIRDYVWIAGFWEYVQPRYEQRRYRDDYRDDYAPRGRAYGHRKKNKHHH